MWLITKSLQGILALILILYMIICVLILPSVIYYGVWWILTIVFGGTNWLMVTLGMIALLGGITGLFTSIERALHRL